MITLREEFNAIKADIDPKLSEFMDKLVNGLELRDTTITNLTSSVQFLERKVNDIERYSSKDCVIISNLPLQHGSDYWEDIIGFFAKFLSIRVNRHQIVACHPLGPINDTCK